MVQRNKKDEKPCVLPSNRGLRVKLGVDSMLRARENQNLLLAPPSVTLRGKSIAQHRTGKQSIYKSLITTVLKAVCSRREKKESNILNRLLLKFVFQHHLYGCCIFAEKDIVNSV